jgi:hypothetical protein
VLLPLTLRAASSLVTLLHLSSLFHLSSRFSSVIPAQAGIQFSETERFAHIQNWVPAYAGMTE